MSKNFTASERFYYLDWLRVFAFTLLFLLHSTQVFSSWGFWLESYETSPVIDIFLLAIKPWRMPLLFIISGAAVFFLFKKRTLMQLIRERTIRLLVPLIAAMVLVIPPQIYFIKLDRGYTESYWEFLFNSANLNWFPDGYIHWMHLWYLAFVFGYTLLLAPLLAMDRHPNGVFFLNYVLKAISRPLLLFLLAIPMAIPYYTVKSLAINHNVEQLTFFFPFFLFGALFVTNAHVKDALRRYAGIGLVGGMFTTLLMYYVLYTSYGDVDVFFTLTKRDVPLATYLFQSFNQWFWLIAIFGFGQRFLNRNSRFLSYATGAVYPFYILHQTVIIIIAYYVLDTNFTLWVKLAVILISSFFVTLGIYEYILKRSSPTRILFGLKSVPKRKQEILTMSDSISENQQKEPVPIPAPLPKKNFENESNQTNYIT